MQVIQILNSHDSSDIRANVYKAFVFVSACYNRVLMKLSLRAFIVVQS